MKTTNSLIAVLALTLFTGCASMSGPFKLKQTRQDVDWAMVRYHNRQAFGFMTAQEQQSVSDAYKAYQTAFNAALKQAMVDAGYRAEEIVRVLNAGRELD